MDLLYELYAEEPGEALHQVWTGQRLIPVRRGDGYVFHYRDSEIEHRIRVDRRARHARIGSAQREVLLEDFEVDWLAPRHRAIAERYGAWRRLSWFLLDALAVWLRPRHPRLSAIRLRGGWQGGRWVEPARLEIGAALPPVGIERLVRPLGRYTPFPLDCAAPRWRLQQAAALGAGGPDRDRAGKRADPARRPLGAGRHSIGRGSAVRA